MKVTIAFASNLSDPVGDGIEGDDHDTTAGTETEETGAEALVEVANALLLVDLHEGGNSPVVLGLADLLVLHARLDDIELGSGKEEKEVWEGERR